MAEVIFCRFDSVRGLNRGTVLVASRLCNGTKGETVRAVGGRLVKGSAVTLRVRTWHLLGTAPLWPSGYGGGLVIRQTQVWILFGSPCSSKVVVCGLHLVTLPPPPHHPNHPPHPPTPTGNETLTWLTSLSRSIQKHSCDVSVATGTDIVLPFGSFSTPRIFFSILDMKKRATVKKIIKTEFGLLFWQSF